MEENTETLSELIRWLNKYSTSKISEKLEVKTTKYGGRGIFAKEEVKAHQQIIKISPNCLLNFTTIVAHISHWNDEFDLPESYNYISIASNQSKDHITNEIYSKLDLQDLLNLSSFQIVSLFLVLEKQRGVNSWWNPFIQMLPSIKDFLTSPLVWKVKSENLDQYNKLPRSTKLHTEKMLKLFNHDYQVLIKLLESKKYPNVSDLLTKDSLLSAWMCVNSRCLYMEIPEGKTNEDNFTMAPYVDFINHSPIDECILKIDRTGFYVQTTLSYKQETELFLSYGPHSNEFLLCEYGFLLPSNDWNDLDITDEIIRLFSEQQIEYLKENDYYGEYTINKDGPSFRTEVALAVLQEYTGLKSNRKLNALLNGVSDGAVYKKGSDLILGKILKKLNKEFQEHSKLEFDNNIYNKVVGQLYRERLELIENTLLKISHPQEEE